MTWLTYALISIVTISIAALLQRILMQPEKSNPVGYAIVFQFGLGLISLVFTIALGKFSLPSFDRHLLQFILSAFLWAGATTFVFKALKRLSAGEVIILGASSAVVSIILSVIFLGEVLKITTLGGTFLVLLSIWLISTEKFSFVSREGVIFALLSAFCIGVAVVNDAIILKTYEAFSYTTIMSFLPGFILLLFFPRQITKINQLLNRKSLSLMFIFCIFSSIQAITYYLALQNGAPVSQLSPLIKSSIVLTVVLAAIFLKERSNIYRKIIAAFIVTVGAILLG